MIDENFYHRIDRLKRTYSFSTPGLCQLSISEAEFERDEAQAEYDRAVAAVEAATAAMRAAADKHQSAFIDANLVAHFAKFGA
jgi:hypothetical protein